MKNNNELVKGLEMSQPSTGSNIAPESNISQSNDHSSQSTRPKSIIIDPDSVSVSAKFKDWSFGRRKLISLRLKQYLWLPMFVLLVITLPFLLISGWISYQQNNFYPVLPFISDIMAHPPVGPYFSQYCDILAILSCVTFWARYKQVKYYLTHYPLSGCTNDPEKVIKDEKFVHRLLMINLSILINAFILAFGICLIGNFPSTENLTVHGAGATIALLNGSYIAWANVYICHKLYTCYGLESRPITMAVAGFLYFSGMLLMYVFSFAASIQNGDFLKFWDARFRLWWTPDLDGHLLHCLASGFEWIGLFAMFPFLYSITRRLRLFQQWHRLSF